MVLYGYDGVPGGTDSACLDKNMLCQSILTTGYQEKTVTVDIGREGRFRYLLYGMVSAFME